MISILLLFEIGMNQGNDIKNIIDKYFNDVTISIEKIIMIEIDLYL